MNDYDKLRTLDDPRDIFSLSDRVGVIMGGSGAMGRQFCKVLSRAGATIISADIDVGTERGEDLAGGERDQADRVHLKRCDAGDEAQVKELFEWVSREYGRLDFLIFNVMGKPRGYYKSFEQYPGEVWDSVIGSNLTGAFFCCRQACRLMERAGQGSIVLTSSIYGMVGPDHRIYEECSGDANPYTDGEALNTPAVYSTTKAGLIGLAKHLATLLGKKNIRVNVLVPGGVYDGQEQSFHDAYVRRTPLGRMGVWTDYNGAILFLASDASRYMTGAVLVIDGGWTAW